ncbi:unnamed protein product [Trichogramma brassicae]|uniref:DNA-directed RNA polymerase III subunit RPC6 n=1 Tax=Trichogramma brassicae TaxID=86971 RepID=A0A6H5I040_9HYME|nr:unnamed protein product [Trichogramma brassicae]
MPIEPDIKQRIAIINDLLGKQIIKLFKVNDQYNYKYNANHEMSVKLPTKEETLIYDLIAKAGDKGIWNRELKEKTKAPDQRLTKITKSLASKKLIKIISSQQLDVPDLEMILDSLIYDGKVDKVTTSDGNNMYRAIARLVEGTGLMKTPCGVCPVRKNCSDVGNITPITCQYFGEWLSY